MSTKYHYTDDLVLIDEGDYEFIYDHHETYLYLGKSPKLAVWFKIISKSKFNGIYIPRYYNVAKVNGKREINGLFDPKGQKSDLVREATLVTGEIPERYNESLSSWKGIVVLGYVHAVQKNSNGQKLHEKLHYSVIKYLYI